MISSESNLVIELWEHIREHITPSRRKEVAIHLLREFTEFGFEKEDLADIVDEDSTLGEAYTEFFNEEYSADYDLKTYDEDDDWS
jgi:hypothetical protein